MKTSPTINKLTKALLDAQKKMGAAVKGSKNPFFKSSYADLPTVMEVMKDPLNEAGIVVLQPPSHRDGKNFITTVLIHAESGEFMESDTEVICAKQNDPQAFGAAQTYARRFGLQAMGFIPAEDDDGNQAAGRTATQDKPKSTPTLAKPNTTTATGTTTLGINSNVVSVTTTQLPQSAFTKEELASQGPAVNVATPTTLQPLKTSSFRNKAKAPPVVTQAPAAASSAEPKWD